MEQFKVKARAKINLGLDVLRRRPDGYHEVRMIMQSISLSDQLVLTKTEDPQIRVLSNLSYIPSDQSNLAYQAAQLLKDQYGLKEGVQIELQKQIPVAAGLAGGSSDAAAVLFSMNQLFQLGLSVEELMEEGLKIGADVPFCMMRGTALAEGIGEQLKPLEPLPDCYILLAKPPVAVSTRQVYEHLEPDSLRLHPDIDGMCEAIRQGDLAGIAERMSNVLETVTAREYPVIGRLKNMMKDFGALNAVMSGSGPTVFGLFDSRVRAEEGLHAIQRSGLTKQVILTENFKNRR